MAILTNTTALELLRKDLLWDRLDTRQCRAKLKVRPTLAEIADIVDTLAPHITRDLAKPWPRDGAPLEVLVDCASARCLRAAHCSWHVWSRSLPAGALRRLVSITSPLYRCPFLVTSPELTYLMLASKLSWPALLLVGYELCGTYRLRPAMPQGFVSEREPLCTPSSVRTFCERYGAGAHGVKAARTSAKYLLSGSASPRESILAVLLTLPRSRGGQSLPAPQLNAQLDLDFEARSLVNRAYLVIDLLWKDLGIGVEYDSKQFHDYGDANKVEQDKRRVNAALRMGVKLITVTNDQLKDVYKFHALVRTLTKLMKRRYVKANDVQLAAEVQLRKALLGKY